MSPSPTSQAPKTKQTKTTPWGGVGAITVPREAKQPTQSHTARAIKTGTLTQKRQNLHSVSQQGQKVSERPILPLRTSGEQTERGRRVPLQPPAGSFYGGRNSATLAQESRITELSCLGGGALAPPPPHSPSLSQFPLSKGPQLSEARPPPPSGQEDKQGWNSTVQDGMSSGQAGLRPLPPPAKREFMGAPPWLLQY